MVCLGIGYGRKCTDVVACSHGVTYAVKETASECLSGLCFHQFLFEGYANT